MNDNRKAPYRTIFPLDGEWEIAEGDYDAEPRSFPSRVRVPGLVDLAAPPFVDVAPPVKDDSVRDLSLSMFDVLDKTVVDPKRQAFWYRRSFTLDESSVQSAILVVRKAQYGIQVTVNGQAVGQHAPNFTPAFFDVTDALIPQGDNLVVIRVGAGRDGRDASRVNGHDNEKLRYIPGIYDSVELRLCGEPRIESVQVAPATDLNGVQVRVTVNAGARTHTYVSDVSVAVFEHESGCEVARATLEKRHLQPGSNQIQVSLSMESAVRWTPDSPFMYRARVQTDGDVCETRFGMRTFEFRDGRAYLNGEMLRLLGTNICMHRFFEDEGRGALPWDKEWARNLIRSFRSMNWSSTRFCIGFPPEFWYDIADEEGLLVQDEFPIWKVPSRTTAEDIAQEFTEWLPERWNHPSVVIWDAQNETRVDEGGDKTSAAIKRVRTLDLQNRPWDNGWAPPVEHGDPVELHPYLLGGRGYTLRDISAWPPKPSANEPFLFEGEHEPAGTILNEYGWIWINRDGTECILAEKSGVFQRLYPSVKDLDSPTRKYLYARTIAALTEYWRARGDLSGVLFFCGLGYSRANGHTSDVLEDVSVPTIEPFFRRFVGDAFSPVAVMLDIWDPPVRPGDRITVPVIMTNDRGADFSGTCTLTISDESRELFREEKQFYVPAHSQVKVVFACSMPKYACSVETAAEIVGRGGIAARSIRDIGVGAVRATPRIPS